jgi:hypothetical protein
MKDSKNYKKTDKRKILYRELKSPANKNSSKANQNNLKLTKKQWSLLVNLIKECELTEEGARVLLNEVKRGNFVL